MELISRIGVSILKDPISDVYIPKPTFLVVGWELSMDGMVDHDDAMELEASIDISSIVTNWSSKGKQIIGKIEDMIDFIA